MNKPIRGILSSQAEKIKPGYQSQSSDTTPQVDMLGFKLLQERSPSQRLAMGYQMNQNARQFSLSCFRQRFSDLSETQLTQKLATAWLGESYLERVMSVQLDSQLPDSLKLREPIPLTIHPAAVYLSGLGEGSTRTIRYALNTIAGLLTGGECDALTLDWTKLRYHHTAAVRVALMRKFAPVTANKMLSALRRVLKEAYKLNGMDGDSYTKAIDFPNIEGEPEDRGRSLSSEEITSLLETCHSDSAMDLRDGALIAILRGTGLRRSELVKLELRDWSPKSESLVVRRGKRGKGRTVYLSGEAIIYLEKWLKVRGSKPGPLLCRIWKSGKLQLDRPMNSDAVWRILKKRASQAGVESFSPHDFRRTFCSDLLDAGVDIVTVQKLAGHASPVTTAKYDRRGEETKRRAVQKLGF